MTEYTGLDLEMAININYHEAMRMVDETLKHIFKGIYDRFRPELEVVKQHFPHEDLVWHEQTTTLTFAEGIRLLWESGWKDDDGRSPSEHEDLHTKAEQRLGELVKKKYHTDYYILDKFPTSARPFYTMLDPTDDRVTNSFDFFVRGQEILSGGQRIHDATVLLERLEKQDIDPDSLKEYIDGFRWVAPPHAGAGIGLERLVSLVLELGNLRYASLFPRDPKSFPTSPPGAKLRQPEDNTLHRPKGRLPPLENLVANYGDATNTSWMDERFQVWRDNDTGAAIAFVRVRTHAIIAGNPLCDTKQYADVIGGFLRWLKKTTHLKPIFVLVGQEVEEVLGTEFGWKSLSCSAEQRVDLAHEGHATDKDVERKIRHAKSAGVKVLDLGQSVPNEIQERCNTRIKEWQENRKGTQVHLSKITPWKDMTHRHYLHAEDKEGKICALVVLAQLAPRYGVQVKWALDFPGAPNGAIEYVTQAAMDAAKADGNDTLTFGGGATAKLTAGHNIGGTKITALDNSYQAIAARLKLNQKTDFRAKFHTYEDPIYICYPPHGGLGIGGVQAIMGFFQDER
jgi:ergosteryl-3beta-O-L-aspartate synthase